MTIEIHTSDRGIIVDKEDVHWLERKHWIAKRGRSIYVRVYLGDRQEEYLHRLIMNPPADKTVDHINGNGLDNRRSNLKVCSHSENSLNSDGHSDRKRSPYKGVTPSNNGKRWVAQIGINYGVKNLGTYDTAEEARDARAEYEKNMQQ